MPSDAEHEIGSRERKTAFMSHTTRVSLQTRTFLIGQTLSPFRNLYVSKAWFRVAPQGNVRHHFLCSAESLTRLFCGPTPQTCGFDRSLLQSRDTLAAH